LSNLGGGGGKVEGLATGRKAGIIADVGGKVFGLERSGEKHLSRNTATYQSEGEEEEFEGSTWEVCINTIWKQEVAKGNHAMEGHASTCLPKGGTERNQNLP